MRMHLTEQWAALLRYGSPDNYLHPQWLLGIGLVVVIGLVLGVTLAWRFKRRLRQFAAARLHVPVRQSAALTFKYVRLFLILLAMASMFFALARPMGYAQSQKASRQGSNFLIALDGSHSMLAEDVKPSRFQLAQQGIESLLNHFGSDRAAAMLFAGTPTLVAPMTFDTVSLQLVMRELTPELSGKAGSSLSAVIERAAEYLSRKNYPSKAIIVFSDGEETEGDAVIAAQKAYQQHGIRVFAIGVGTATGSAIPKWERNLNRELVKAGVVKDAQEQIVQSRLDEQTLQLMASVAGGHYVDLNTVKGDLGKFYQEFLRPLAAPLDAVPLEDRQEWFTIPLWIGLVLLILELLCPQSLASWRKQTRLSMSTARPTTRAFARVKGKADLPDSSQRSIVPRRTAAALQILLGSLLFSGLWIPPSVDARSITRTDSTDPTLRPAEQLLDAGQYDKAFRTLQRTLLDHPNDPLVRYNYAIGAYAAGRFAVALETFEKLAGEPHAQVQARSYLQWGNTLYRIGELMVKDNPEGAIVHWSKALEAYQPVRGEPIVNHNARYVRDLLLARLYQLGRIREREGDDAASIEPIQGTNAWQEAIVFYDQALKVAVEEDQIKSATQIRAGVVGKIYRAYMEVAEEKRRQALDQKIDSLELAIDEMAEAVKHYTAALVVKENDPKATEGLKAAQKVFEPWQLEYAGQLTDQGVELRHADVEKTIVIWQQADALYTRVLEQNADSKGAQQGQTRLHPQMADAYREVGDRSYQYSNEPIHTEVERQRALQEALDAYQMAQRYAPNNAAIAAQVMKVGRRLAGKFFERGQQEYDEAQKVVRAQPPEAMGWLEKAIQSYNRGLLFDQKNVAGLAGRERALEQLKELRIADAESLRRQLAAQKKDPKAEQAGKKALKLLKVDTEKLLKQGELKPQDRAVKDW